MTADGVFVLEILLEIVEDGGTGVGLWGRLWRREELGRGWKNKMLGGLGKNWGKTVT